MVDVDLKHEFYVPEHVHTTTGNNSSNNMTKNKQHIKSGATGEGRKGDLGINR